MTINNNDSDNDNDSNSNNNKNIGILTTYANSDKSFKMCAVMLFSSCVYLCILLVIKLYRQWSSLAGCGNQNKCHISLSLSLSL